jgi:nucleotide-binding universal stress UspA family protein
MPNVCSIICPVDFSEQSGQALLWASAIAQHRGGELTVLTVLEPLLAQAAGIRLGVDLAREEAEPALREFVEATLPERVRQASHVRMEVTVGDPSEAILHTARRLKAGLIVMGTHGLGGFRKLPLGSTTAQVLRRTEWPVLAVPPRAVSAPAVEHPGVQLRRILLGTDFRESAMAAMQWAGDLASEIGVPLVLAHVVEPVVMPPRWQALDFESDRVASGQRLLARLSASFRDTHSDCVVSVGRPADTIASLAVEYEAGLVVMGLANAGDSELRKPGSIAYRVLRIAHVAVVVVPHREAQAAPDQPRAGHDFQSLKRLTQSRPEH